MDNGLLYKCFDRTMSNMNAWTSIMRKPICTNRRLVFLTKHTKYNFNYHFIKFKKEGLIHLFWMFLQCVCSMFWELSLVHFCSLLVVPIFRYHDGGVYVIDVSQSVEHDHPCALEFLRKDCTNVTGQLKDFFG